MIYLPYLPVIIQFIVISLLGAFGMVDLMWVLINGQITLIGMVLGLMMQSKKYTERIKDIDDKTSKIELTHENTKELLLKLDNYFRNANLSDITKYVIRQEAKQEITRSIRG